MNDPWAIPNLVDPVDDELDLHERHAELRLEVVNTRHVHARNRSRDLHQPGAYEWWQVTAIDRKGDGFIAMLFNGMPFHPAYRLSVERFRAGDHLDSASIRCIGYPGAMVAVFRGGRLVARSTVAETAGSFSESDPDQPSWWIRLPGASLSEQGEGWRLELRLPVQRVGMAGLAAPGVSDHRWIAVEARITPRFHTYTLQRASMPDSPSAATHEWLLACPAALVSGHAVIHSGSDSDRREGEDSETAFSEVPATLDHFWGTGPIGEGTRRWYRSVVAWEDGAAVAELPIIRKFMQLSGTIMRFRSDRLPDVARCQRPPHATYQRSTWLLAYPLDLVYQSPGAGAMLRQKEMQLYDVAPWRLLASNRTTFEFGFPPDEVMIEDAVGWLEMMQFSRLNAPLWRRWLQPLSASEARGHG